MNEGLNVFLRLTDRQREARLRRCGLKAAMTPAGRTRLERSGISAPGEPSAQPYYAELSSIHRQQYIVRIFNLQVVDIQGLGAGQAMGRQAGIRVEEGPAVIGGIIAGEAVRPEEGSVAGATAAVPGPGNGYNRRGTAGQLRETAVRALYSLGLDSGEVRLSALGGRQYAVEEVIPFSVATGEIPGFYQAAAQALSAALGSEQSGRPGLLMGMDPEFILLRESTGRVVPASRYLPLDGVAGCDAGPPGTRGTFPVAELRPQPRGEPRALLAQLMSAVRAADRLIADRELCWRAGGMPLPGWALGGHLHFSGVTLTAPLLRALDNYLALPLMLLEDAGAAGRRPRYGVLGDFRIQPHGGFEYRTLPSFLVSPVIARGAVFLAHLIVSRYEDLALRPLDREELHAAYYSGVKPPLRAAFIPLQAQLRGLPGYTQAARYIEPLLGYIAAERTWDESRDIRGLWRTKEAAPAASVEV
ncbi:putative amidoligase domain-containing protein [Paenibacillus sp. FSL R7-0331]|uniref:putative amidoligase domain-containing protein n=1 Tax=Paenibacillus sp. FSL R7-0331 TaxID=1536773 RepID=UPI000693E3D9|nr:hypothetical protein [Paenibacillus sp. FSL R7-0331]